MATTERGVAGGILALTLTVFAATGFVAGQTGSLGAPSADQVEFFESTIRPLLANNCFQCHSARTSVPFGGLRLDSRDGLLVGGDTGPAVVPGQPQDSPLIQRIQGRPVLMPPTGRLSDTDIIALTTWVQMGAPWPDNAGRASSDTPDPSQPFDLPARRQSHWAWHPVQAFVPPTVTNNDWPATPVDQFVLAKLEDQKLQPAPDASRAALIRRLSFDLRGLPPTLAEVARFTEDESPTAYSELVDRYLASAHFGERWARHWMDLFRYTESNGMENDPDIPFAWRYRDYLIRAFNGDVSYDQLVREHLAGDLLLQPRLDHETRINESLLGTANFRLVEHGYAPVDPWEDRVKWTDNQVDVASKAFLGLTASCARCHDHKFDAISQKDYYSLFGTVYGARPTMRAIDDPALLDTNKDALKTLKVDIREMLASEWNDVAQSLGRELMASREENTDVAGGVSAPDIPVARRVDAPSANEARVGSVLAAWRELSKVEAAGFSRAWSELRARWDADLDERTQFNAENFTSQWDLSGPDYAAMVGHGTGRTMAPSKPGQFVIPPRGDQLLAGIYPGGAYTHLLSSKHAGVIQTPRFRIDSDYISFRVLGDNLSFAQVVIENYSTALGGVYQGMRYSPKQDAMTWALVDTRYWKGFTAYIEFATQDDVTRFQLDPADRRLRNQPTRRGDGRSSIGASQIVFHDVEETPKETVVPLLSLFDAADASNAPTTHEELATLIGQQLSEVVQAWGDERLTERQVVFLDEFVRADFLPRSLETLVALRAPIARYRELENEVPVARRAPGVVEEAAPDQPLLVRGNHRNLGDIVPRGFFTAIDNRPYDDPGLVRLHLADAVTDRENPLTARVAVNRVWRHLFGHGIVRTVDNFGRLGDLPSHPELLDYLADEFVDDDYSIKRLVRRLVLSRVYRMSSQPSAQSLEHDPTNRYLQHANLRRLDAEAIRDAILSVSGRLNPTMYGPSVPVHYAPIDEGDSNNGPLDGDGRRSVYQEIRRNAHNPFLEVFDLPKPATTRGQRDTTNVPAQSLALLNSPFVIEQATKWGEALAEGEAGSIDGRIDHMFLKALARLPSRSERDRIVDYVAGVAEERGADNSLLLYDVPIWKDVAHTLFNLKEFIFVP